MKSRLAALLRRTADQLAPVPPAPSGNTITFGGRPSLSYGHVVSLGGGNLIANNRFEDGAGGWTFE